MARLLHIDGKEVGPGRPVFVIAEAGVNHNGRLDLALELTEAAARAGADAVKFQTFRADELASPHILQADYQKRAGEKTQREMLRELELPREAYPVLIQSCREKGISFLSTPFDVNSLEFLVELGMPAVKVPSGEATNLPFLRRIASVGRPVILSTGMTDLEEVREAISVIRENGDPPLAVLHCTTSYPAPPETINLRAMLTLAEGFDVPVGLSDHSEGTEVPLAATALGAAIIEKHFTLSRGLPGPDHRCSLEPGELARMVAGIRKVEAALGNGEKRPHPCEEAVKRLVRRWLAFARDVRAGETIGIDDTVATRCDGEIPPAGRESVVGRKLREDQAAWTPVRWQVLE